MGQVAPPVVEDGILPFSSHFVTVAGKRLHYIDEGSGPVVLAVHGNPTWCYYYRNLVRNLSDRFRVIAPDFLGCGFSDRTPGIRLRAMDRVQHLEEFIDILGLKHFDLVMHDWGGPIATTMATRRPDSIGRIVYLNTTLTETESLPQMIKLAATPVIGEILTRYTKRFLHFTTGLGVARKLSPDIIARYHFPYRTRRERQAIWDFVVDIPFDPSHPSYSTMMGLASKLDALKTKPIKVIWGLQDPCFHRGMLSKVLAHFPSAEVIEIPDASHLVLEDAPEIAIPAIREFLLRGRDSEVEKTEDVTPPQPTEHTLFSRFVDNAERRPHERLAVAARGGLEARGEGKVSYRYVSSEEMLKTVRQYERGLSALGLAPGDRVLMLVPPGVEFLALALAVMGRGATPVFIDPGVGKERLLRCIRDAAPHAFIGSAKAFLLKLLDRDVFKRMKFSVLAENIYVPGKHSLSFFKRYSDLPLPKVSLPTLQDRLGRDRQPAMIAFTSGATGTPKGVVFTNDVLRAELEIFEKYFQMRAGGTDLPLLGVFSLFNAALGVCSVFTPSKPGKPLALDPSFIIQVVRDLGVESSFGAPVLWNKISEYCVRSNMSMPTMKRIFMAGAPVTRSVLELCEKVMSNVSLYTPYGATEALPITLAPSKELAQPPPALSLSGEMGICVGRVLEELEVRIVALRHAGEKLEDLGEVVPVAAIGEVFVCGRSVSPEYLHRPDANKSAKYIDDSGRLWHRLGDVGYFDSFGRLYFCGRAVDSVITSEKTYHTYPVEEVFNAEKKIQRTALVSVHNGQTPLIVVEPRPECWPDSATDRTNFERELVELAASNPVTTGIKNFLFHRSLPVDPRHNAKIQRDQLRIFAERELLSSTKRAA